MTFTVIHSDAVATVLADDPIVSAAAVPALSEAVAMLAEARRIRDDAHGLAEAVRSAAHAEGRAAGYAEGSVAGAAEYRTKLFDLAVRDAERTRQRHQEAATLALEVVRRIAGAIGEGPTLAAIAEREVASIAPDVAATVRVSLSAYDDVKNRLAGYPAVSVEGDPDLAAMDCIVETPLGRTHAGLATQLAQIEQAWAQIDRG
jgi:type III secretion protein L